MAKKGTIALAAVLIGISALVSMTRLQAQQTLYEHAEAELAVAGAQTRSTGSVANAQEPSPSLDDTMDWLDSTIESDTIDPSGVRIRRQFFHTGCRVRLTRTGGQLLLVEARFDLKQVTRLALREAPSGRLWTNVYLQFRTSDAARINVNSLSGGRESVQSFDWMLGFVRAGTSTKAHLDLGQRLVNAFTHAVTQCGGSIRQEPF